jgi:hypothetical protein
MSDEQVAAATAHYPPADITPAEFEEYVVELLKQTAPAVDDLRVTLHERIAAADGSYDFDATVRFALGGLAFLTLVEAKRHRDAIKRELVQVLHAKLESVGAQKALMISTAPYRRGALHYAAEHGIATVTEGRFTFHTRSAVSVPALTRAEARERYGLPVLAGHLYQPGDGPGITQVRALAGLAPEDLAELLLGAPPAP